MTIEGEGLPLTPAQKHYVEPWTREYYRGVSYGLDQRLEDMTDAVERRGCLKFVGQVTCKGCDILIENNHIERPICEPTPLPFGKGSESGAYFAR